MRDGVTPVHGRLLAEGRRRKPYPMMLMRTPYSVAPYGVGQLPRQPRSRRRCSARKVTSSSTRTCAGAGCRKASTWTCGRYKPRTRDRRDTDESSDTYDTVDWLVKRVPQQQRPGGHVGHLVPGLLRRHRHDRRASGAQGGLSAGAHHRLVRRATTSTTTAPSILPHAFNFLPGFGQPRPEPDRAKTCRALDSRHPDGYEFFLRMGPLANVNEPVLHGEVPFWNELMQHPNYDEFWQARNLRPHLQQHQAGGDDRRGVVRCRGPLRRAGDVQERRRRTALAPSTCWSWGRGSTAAGRAADGDSLGRRARFDSKTAEFFRENMELPFFNHFLKDKGEARTSRGLGLRDRGATSGGRSTRLAARRRQTRARSISMPAASCRSIRRPKVRGRRTTST